MAVFRTVQCSFWSDPDLVDVFTPEDRYFYLWLMTNEHTSQCGIYQVSVKQMAFETGYSIESVRALVKRFEQEHKRIRYNPETRELAIRNHLKHNGPKSADDNIYKRIVSELAQVHDKSLVGFVVDQAEPALKALLSPLVAPSEPLPRTSPKDKEEDKEKEEYVNTAHAREGPNVEAEKPEATDPEIGAPGEAAMPRAVFDAWVILGDQVYQPGDFATAFASRWGELRRSIRGVHSDDVLAAIRNFGTILAGPPGRYYWNQRITIQAFLEKHLEKFLPTNFKPDDFLVRGSGKTASPAGKPKSPEELEKLRKAREQVYGKEATDEWYARQCKAAV